MSDKHAIRAGLLALKSDLESQREAAVESRKPVELDQQSVGRVSRQDALQGQAMAQATDSRRVMEIRRIEAALARLDEDEYGYCLQCGEPIQPKRLELDPAGALCVDCAA